MFKYYQIYVYNVYFLRSPEYETNFYITDIEMLNFSKKIYKIL